MLGGLAAYFDLHLEQGLLWRNVITGSLMIWCICCSVNLHLFTSLCLELSILTFYVPSLIIPLLFRMTYVVFLFCYVKIFTDMNLAFQQSLPFLFCRLIFVTREHWKWFLLQQGKITAFSAALLYWLSDSVPFSHHYEFIFFVTNLYPARSLSLDNLLLRFDAVVHFAGLKAVGESVQKPLLYYDNNVIGTINLLEVMSAHGCKKVFAILPTISLLGPLFPNYSHFFWIYLQMYARSSLWFNVGLLTRPSIHFYFSSLVPCALKSYYLSLYVIFTCFGWMIAVLIVMRIH